MDPFANLSPLLPAYLSHRNYGTMAMPATISDLDTLIRKDYSGNILFNVNNNETLNLNHLSNDVGMMNTNINAIISRINTMVQPAVDPEKEEMKQRIDQLEEMVRRLEFLLGDN